MMTEQEALIRRVCLDPADDLPRLIYADWCDGDGQQERAEFIRLQCLLASRYPPSIDDRLHCTKPFRAGVNMVSIAGVPKGTPMATCKACEVCRDMGQLRRRELELLHSNEREWMGEIGPHAWINPSPYNESRACWATNEAAWIAPKWERGWIAEITCTATQWLTHGPAIVRQQPITRVVPGSTTFTREGDALREVMLRANIPVEMNQSDAAITWARREAGLEVECSRCDGNGSHRWLLGHGDGNIDEVLCDVCQGTGWRSAE